MKVLITGSNGQLGSEIKELASDYENLECIFRDLPELDICDTKALTTCIVDENINAVINCAAYTAVDKAEEKSCNSTTGECKRSFKFGKCPKKSRWEVNSYFYRLCV